MEKGEVISDILTNYEAEKIIEALSIFDIKEYGCNKWFEQDQQLQRINLQIHLNALMNTEQFIMETCVTFDKVKVLIYELICCEIWKQQVFPLLKAQVIQSNSYRAYIVVFHEAVICNLLEVIMYHRTAVENADNYLLELIDYCYRKFLGLTKRSNTKAEKSLTVQQALSKTKLEDYQDQYDDIEFKVSMMCISIIRFISDYVKYLPIGIVHHLLIETDMLCILVPLIECRPWLRQNSKNEREKFENSKWQVVDKNDFSKLPKLEANVWITIYNLFMDPECRKKYELNDFRKNNLLRLRKYMNEILLDQLPNLSFLLRTLEELSIMNTAAQAFSNPFVVQQMPEIQAIIMNKKNWKEIAEYQMANFFSQRSQQQQMEEMKKFAELYGQNIIEGLIDGFKCQQCKKDASKRCSRCKQAWYCSRECQLQHWGVHRALCNQAMAQKEAEQQGESTQKKEQEEGTKQDAEQKKKIVEVQPGKQDKKDQASEAKQNQAETNLDDID